MKSTGLSAAAAVALVHAGFPPRDTLDALGLTPVTCTYCRKAIGYGRTTCQTCGAPSHAVE